MAKDLMPTADLDDPRNLDVPEMLLARLSLFSALKSPLGFDKFPGSVALRRYAKGDVVCRLGEAGWTAFYILTGADLNLLRTHPRTRLQEGPRDKEKLTAAVAAALAQAADSERRLADPATDAKERAALPRKIETLKKEAEKHRAALSALAEEMERWRACAPTLEREVAAAEPGSNGPVVMAEAYLPKAHAVQAPSRGLLGKLAGWLTGGSRRRAIAAEGHRVSPMHEGDLFGEMSCFYRAPRSATVVATRELYVLVLLRNILDKIQKDKNYEQRFLDTLRARALRSHLLDLPAFSVLRDADIDELCRRVELQTMEPGTLLYDEHDRSDCMHLIGGGVVKVLHNASWLLSVDHIGDWRALCGELAGGEKKESGGKAPHSNGAPQAQAAIQAGITGPLTLGQKAEIVDALNEVIKDTRWHEEPELLEVIRRQQLGRRVWQYLAAASRDSAAAMQECNRLVLAEYYKPAFPADLPDVADDSRLLREDEIGDWKAFATKLLADNPLNPEPGKLMLRLLDESVRERLRAAQTAPPSPADKQAILAGLNGLTGSLPLVLFEAFHEFVQAKHELAKKVQTFLLKNERWTPFAFDRFVRALHRFLLDALYGGELAKTRRPSGPPAIVAYRGRGEFLGEIGLLENLPRSATCVAYSHPENDPDREVGPVQLVRVGKELFDELLGRVTGLRQHVDQVIAKRRADSKKRKTATGPQGGYQPLVSDRAEQLGLIEGQKLMLIQLDRCTRCDECVKACIDTHDDGRSRLFLSGERFNNYLVPTTCRSCLDPVCLIGCPVASIRRGNDKQIVIEPWCIGCGLCAGQCPYGAIQMHELGIVARGAPGWRVLPARAVTSPDWIKPAYADRAWEIVRAPLYPDRAFHEMVLRQGAEPATPVNLRLSFRFDQLVTSEHDYKVEVISTKAAMDSLSVWLNGEALASQERAKQVPKSGCYRKEYPVGEPAKVLRPGGNVVCVQLTPEAGADAGEPFFDLSLFAVRRLTGDVTEKTVTQRAVVCDLCSTLPSGPACVRACPHDAALRVDARFEFPGRAS